MDHFSSTCQWELKKALQNIFTQVLQLSKHIDVCFIVTEIELVIEAVGIVSLCEEPHE